MNEADWVIYKGICGGDREGTVLPSPSHALTPYQHLLSNSPCPPLPARGGMRGSEGNEGEIKGNEEENEGKF